MVFARCCCSEVGGDVVSCTSVVATVLVVAVFVTAVLVIAVLVVALLVFSRYFFGAKPSKQTYQKAFAINSKRFFCLTPAGYMDNGGKYWSCRNGVVAFVLRCKAANAVSFKESENNSDRKPNIPRS